MSQELKHVTAVSHVRPWWPHGAGDSTEVTGLCGKTLRLEHEVRLSRLRLQQVVNLLRVARQEFGSAELPAACRCPWTAFRLFWSRLGAQGLGLGLWCCSALPLKWRGGDSPKGLGTEV